MGPDYPDLSELLAGAAEALVALGRFAEARKLATRAVAVWVKAFGEEDPNITQQLRILADAELHLGVTRAALRHLERARAVDTAVPITPLNTAEIGLVYARALWANRQPARAREAAKAARKKAVAAGKGGKILLTQIDHWLAAHGSH